MTPKNACIIAALRNFHCGWRAIFFFVLTMRLSGAGVRRHKSKLLYPDHRPSPWLNEDVTPRDRSNRLLGNFYFGAKASYSFTTSAIALLVLSLVLAVGLLARCCAPIPINTGIAAISGGRRIDENRCPLRS